MAWVSATSPTRRCKCNEGREGRPPGARDGSGNGITRIDLWGLRVRAEAACACAATESRRAGVQGVGESGRLVCLKRSRNRMNREGMATVPIPANGLRRT